METTTYAQKRAITDMLHQLGFSPVSQGTWMMREAVLSYLAEPRGKFTVLYERIGKAHGGNGRSCERAMRYALERAWLRGDYQLQQRLFGWSLDPERGRPTVSECIAGIAGWFRDN